MRSGHFASETAVRWRWFQNQNQKRSRHLNPNPEAVKKASWNFYCACVAAKIPMADRIFQASGDGRGHRNAHVRNTKYLGDRKHA
jgi:hypothetical protein